MKGLGLYVHIPFCARLCPYCSFASVAGKDEFRQRYVDAVCCELRDRASRLGKGPLQTIFFGGGTPSRLDAEQIGQIVETASGRCGIESDAEVTLEVNPEGADRERFAGFRRVGVNRLSIGMQSFCDDSLRKLGRIHDVRTGERACELARVVGFDNVSFDLIFSIPGMPGERWLRTLERAVELKPEHISAYALTIEEGTPFARRLRQGRLRPVDEEEDAANYERTIERLSDAGYEQYEVSNFALPGKWSRHNWGYWTGVEYLGVGLSAHSFLDGRRCWNTPDLKGYIEAIEAGGSPQEGEERIDGATALRERIWMGLRIRQGIAVDGEERRKLEATPRFRDLLEGGYLEFTAGGRLRPTRRGFAVADVLGLEVTGILEEKRMGLDDATGERAAPRRGLDVAPITG